jgi:hypothetical protein
VQTVYYSTEQTEIITLLAIINRRYLSAPTATNSSHSRYSAITISLYLPTPPPPPHPPIPAGVFQRRCRPRVGWIAHTTPSWAYQKFKVTFLVQSWSFIQAIQFCWFSPFPSVCVCQMLTIQWRFTREHTTDNITGVIIIIIIIIIIYCNWVFTRWQ